MEKYKSDEKLEHYIADALVRKGEQEAIQDLAGVESVDKLRQIMNEAEQKHQSPKMNFTRGEKRRPAARFGNKLLIAVMSVAAMIAVVMIIGFQPRYSTDELFTKWNDAVPYESVIVRGGDDVSEAQKEALEAAITLAASGKTEEAIEILLPLAADVHSELREDAQWQLAMVYLKSGERIRAKTLLYKIVKNAGMYSKEAAELVNEINKKRWF